MKTHELATHVAIASKLSIDFSAHGPQFEMQPVANPTPSATLDAIESVSDEALDTATFLIRCDQKTLNRHGYDGNKIASRYRALQKKLKGDHLHAWQKAIEQVTGQSISKIRTQIHK
jgi:hypothetical protein